MSDELRNRVQALADKWHKDAIDTGFAMDSSANELFELLDAIPAAPAVQPDADPNAPWLTLAHTICADAGIAPGNITDRLNQLRERMPDASEREFNNARLRRVVNLLGLDSTVPEGDLLGVMGSVLGMVAREIEELQAAPANPCPLCDGEGTAPAWTKEKSGAEPVAIFDGYIDSVPVIKLSGSHVPVGTEFYAAPVPAIPPGYALVPIRRSYEMRAAAFLHFNTAEQAGKDRDDAMEAAWIAQLAAAPQPPVPQDVRDAQRYRFLRNPLNDVEGISSICAGEAMDDAIDAAIAAQDAGKGGAK